MHRSSGIVNIKKKMRGISREENFTSEKYNSVYTSCIDDRVYTRSLMIEKLEDRFDSPSVPHDCTFSRAEKLLRIGIYLALPTVCKNDYAKSCANRSTVASYVLSCVIIARDAIDDLRNDHLRVLGIVSTPLFKDYFFRLERNCFKRWRGSG